MGNQISHPFPPYRAARAAASTFAALIGCAIIRFKGGDPIVADGFRAASARLPQILAWALD